MSKKFYIGICCLALLATSVASAYSEDFEGYTGNVGDPWDGTPEFAASGWTDLYGGTELFGPTSPFDLAAGYNSTQGIVAAANAGGARLLDAPQGANGTFVYTAMMNIAGRPGLGDAAMIVFGTDELLAPQVTHDGWFAETFWDYDAFGGGTIHLRVTIDGTGGGSPGWTPSGIDFYDVGWVEVKNEVDTNASSRPTVIRLYWRDLEEDGSGPVGDGSWTQIDWGGTGGGYDLDMTGADYKIEAVGFRVSNRGVSFDNLVATVNPPFAELPGDVDGDGFIDDDDLNIILGNWGKSGMGRDGGDLNENGVVDGPDYAEVLSYWAPPEPPSQAIPEPATLVLLLIGGLALVRRRG